MPDLGWVRWKDAGVTGSRNSRSDEKSSFTAVRRVVTTRIRVLVVLWPQVVRVFFHPSNSQKSVQSRANVGGKRRLAW